MKENTTEFVILGLLGHRDMTGYDIGKTMSTRLNYIWDLSNGQIYPTLRTLERAKLITKKVETKDTGPTRKVYSITTEGTEKLRAWLLEPAKPEINRWQFLLKLIFGDQSNVDVNKKHMQDFRARNAKTFETMSQFEENLKAMPNQTDEQFYVSLIVMLGKSISKVSVEWADNALQRLEKHQLGGESNDRKHEQNSKALKDLV